MKTDNIKEIKIDDLSRLCIYPEKETFEFIYRQAAGVNWDSKELFLHSQTPRDMSHVQWYQQIVMVVKNEYGYDLLLTSNTVWTNISTTLKEQILAI